MVARTRVKFGRAFFQRFRGIERTAVTKRDVDRAVGPLIEDIRSGKNPRTGRDFKRLQASTIQRRERLATVNSTGPNFAASRSNVTLTGAFLKSIRSSFRKFRNVANLTIRISGRHPGYNLIRGGRSRGALNADIARGLRDKGFPVLDISQRNIREIRERLTRSIESRFRRRRRRRR